MSKKTTFATVVGFVAAMGIMIPAGNVESAPEARELRVTPAQDDPYETLPIIDAYYEGEKLWFIHTAPEWGIGSRAGEIHQTDVNTGVNTPGVRSLKVSFAPFLRPKLHRNLHSRRTEPLGSHRSQSYRAAKWGCAEKREKGSCVATVEISSPPSPSTPQTSS